jgi:putative heme-binding domain-containing protein
MLLFAASVSAQQHKPGEQLFVNLCAGCHGLDAKGGEHAPDIATAPEVQALSKADLTRIVRNGIPAAGMPAFASRLSDDQLTAVISYLRALQGKTNAAPVSGNSDTGRALFFGKGGCAECHMMNGLGGFFAADLSAYGDTHSFAEIRHAIVTPNPEMDPRRQIATVVTRGDKKYSGVARNEDNYSLQLQTPDGTFHLFEKSDVSSVRYERRSFMPDDYASKLSRSELDDLVAYVVQVARGH